MTMHWFNFKACNISQKSEILAAERRLECRKGEDRVLNWHRGVGNRNTACVHMHLIIPFPLNHWPLAATDHARSHTSSQCHVTSHHHLSNNWKRTSQQRLCVSSLGHFPLVTSKAFHADHHLYHTGVCNVQLNQAVEGILLVTTQIPTTDACQMYRAAAHKERRCHWFLPDICTNIHFVSVKFRN